MNWNDLITDLILLILDYCTTSDAPILNHYWTIHVGGSAAYWSRNIRHLIRYADSNRNVLLSEDKKHWLKNWKFFINNDISSSCEELYQISQLPIHQLNIHSFGCCSTQFVQSILQLNTSNLHSLQLLGGIQRICGVAWQDIALAAMPLLKTFIYYGNSQLLAVLLRAIPACQHLSIRVDTQAYYGLTSMTDALRPAWLNSVVDSLTQMTGLQSFSGTLLLRYLPWSTEQTARLCRAWSESLQTLEVKTHFSEESLFKLIPVELLEQCRPSSIIVPDHTSNFLEWCCFSVLDTPQHDAFTYITSLHIRRSVNDHTELMKWRAALIHLERLKHFKCEAGNWRDEIELQHMGNDRAQLDLLRFVAETWHRTLETLVWHTAKMDYFTTLPMHTVFTRCSHLFHLTLLESSVARDIMWSSNTSLQLHTLIVGIRSLRVFEFGRAVGTNGDNIYAIHQYLAHANPHINICLSRGQSMLM